MGKQVNHKIRKHFNDIIYQIARYTEVLLSIVILIVIALSSIALAYELTHVSVLDMDMDFFTDFLARALSLVVGVEFVKMLCKHTAETVVEVLLFATARQMVVEHMPTKETLIGVIAIAILFAVRKYLLFNEDFTYTKARTGRKGTGFLKAKEPEVVTETVTEEEPGKEA